MVEHSGPLIVLPLIILQTPLAASKLRYGVLTRFQVLIRNTVQMAAAVVNTAADRTFP